MHVLINRIHFGNFRFFLELEAGSELEEPRQLTLWVAEKNDIRTIPLDEFTLEQLLFSLKEPLRSQLHQQLEARKQTLRQTFAAKASSLPALPPRKLPQKSAKDDKMRELRYQQEKALDHLEKSFRQQTLLTLERIHYDLEILQAESQFFGEKRFLRHFYDQDADTEIWQFCFQFAFDPHRRAEILAEAGG